MRTTLTRRLAVIGAATTALTLGLASAAIAGPPFTVTVGTSSATVGHPITTTPSAFTFPGGSCSSVSFDGTVNGGLVATPPYPIIELASSTWGGCVGLTVTQSGTWRFEAASGPTGGVTSGDVTGIAVHVADTATSGSLCSFDLTGSVPATFTNSTQVLELDGPGLTVTGVTGCFGLVSDGDQGSLDSAALTVVDPVTASAYPIVIS